MHKIQDYINLLQEENLIESIELCGLNTNTDIIQIAHNSKSVTHNTLYICKGIKYKPEYLEEAINNGACLYVAEGPNVTRSDFPHIVVNNIQKALASISCLFYDFPAKKINMLGITGTKGKSTTAYYIKSILDNYSLQNNLPDTAILSSINNYDGKSLKESSLTSPESIDLQKYISNAVDSKMQNFVMEVSSQALKLDRVHNVMYKVGVFLNISEDHISSIEHPNFEDYFSSKLKFFNQVETACINLDSDYIDRIMQSAKNSKNIITFSTKNSDANVYAYDIKKKSNAEISFRVRASNLINISSNTDNNNSNNNYDVNNLANNILFDEEMLITMPGFFNVENALAAICVAICLGIPYENIYNGLKVAKASGRMESHISKDGNIIVIVDYAHNKLSFQKLYESTEKEYPGKRIVTVFGCPGGKAVIRRKDMGTLAALHSSMNYLTTDDPGPENPLDICKEISQYIEKENGKYEIIEDRGQAIKKAILENPGSIVLVAGKGNDSTQKVGSRLCSIPY